MTKLTLDLEVSDQLAARIAALPQKSVNEAVNQGATVALIALADKIERGDDAVFAALAVALALADKEEAMRLSVTDVEKTTLALFALLQAQNDAAQDALSAARNATQHALNALRVAQENAKREN